MNRFMNSTTMRVTLRGLSLAACVVALTMQPKPSSASGTNPPGTVTIWGEGGLRPAPLAFPTGVSLVSISAYEYAGGMAIAQDGSLYDWFVTSYGPGKVAFPPAVTTVFAASKRFSHTLALTNDGLYSWGGNDKGQLGDGTTVNRSTPDRVIFPPAVTSVTGIAAGYSHSLAITNDGLYAWGDNWNGELGDGTRFNRSLPVKVALPPTVHVVSQVAAGRNTSYAITDDGVFAWGSDFSGQLGNGSFGTLPDGSTDGGRTLPERVLFNNKVTSVTTIAAGEYYAMAITNDGLYAWGMDLSGDLGTGTGTIALPAKVRFPKTVTSVKAIAASTSHSLAITNDGLYAWGNNAYGVLGIGNKGSQSFPTKVQGEDNAIAVAASEYTSIALH